MIIGRCTFDGCALLTIGSRCVEHDFPVKRTFVRGRPFEPKAATTRGLLRWGPLASPNASTARVAPAPRGEVFSRV